MPHRYRHWASYPPPSETEVEKARRSSRVVAVCLTVGLLLCVAAFVALFALVFDLKASRDREVRDRTTAIDSALCQVLDNFHRTSPELQRVRVELHCPVVH